jgi:4-amino-4-deoxy-L-arabinose transferase-like glycosyltransferase
VLLHIGWPLLQIAILMDVADDEVRCTMKSTILWPLVVGAVVALILVITAVSMSASGFRLDVERWVLIGAFLVVISMAAAAVVSALNALKEVRERSPGDNSRSNTSSGSS